MFREVAPVGVMKEAGEDGLEFEGVGLRVCEGLDEGKGFGRNSEKVLREG